MVAGYFCDINSIGMAISINDFRVAIRIDNSEAKAKFDETREQIARRIRQRIKNWRSNRINSISRSMRHVKRQD